MFDGIRLTNERLITLFNILWFGYHIIHETVSIREIKAKMSFYLAISAIISSGVILPIFKELFNITIISITVGFTWVKHQILLIYLILTDFLIQQQDILGY